MILRVAFTLFGGRDWLGGYNYLLNMSRVIGAYSDGRVTPVLFVGDDIEKESICPFREAGCEVIISPHFNQSRKILRLLAALIGGKDARAEKLFLDHGIDTVFEHAVYYGWRFKLPTIAWLVDFQHRYLPEMFSTKAYWRRDIGMRLQIKSGRTVMVSSEVALQDCKRFFGLSADRVHVVRFAVPTPLQAESHDAGAICAKYDLPNLFFYLPNQFWKHKNHMLVLRALALLRNPNIVVVSTGRCEDIRHPGYFHEIMDAVHSEGLENNFRILGIVPYADLIELMKASVAVINPSLFEGWSTTVEEAKSLGVPLLLSDIPVHREQVGEWAKYFRVDDEGELARLFQQYVKNAKEPVRTGCNPADNTDARLRKFAQDIENVAAISMRTN